MLSVDKRRRDVAEDYGGEVLMRIKPIEARVWGIELVPSNVRDPGGKAEEESLNGNDICRVDRTISINVPSR